MRKNILYFILVGIICISCKNTTGLEPVSGVGGKLSFSGNWDAEIQAAAMIALDKEFNFDPATTAEHLVTFSNLIDSGVEEAEYFIQLPPEQYFLATIGLTVDPGLFAAKLDSILGLEEIPIELLNKDIRNLSPRIFVYSNEITEVNREITL